MKRFQTFLALGLLTAGVSTVRAESMSLNSFKPHVLPVLVQVNSSGKVTSVSSSIELSPPLNRLLRSSLDAMITKPATYHGRPTSSEFVINLAMRTTPRADGKFDAHFAYVSASPVPYGSWYWSHQDGHQLALINRNGLDRAGRRQFNRDYQDRNVSQGSFSPPPQFSAPQQTAANDAAKGKSGR